MRGLLCLAGFVLCLMFQPMHAGEVATTDDVILSVETPTVVETTTKVAAPVAVGGCTGTPMRVAYSAPASSLYAKTTWEPRTRYYRTREEEVVVRRRVGSRLRDLYCSVFCRGCQ